MVKGGMVKKWKRLIRRINGRKEGKPWRNSEEGGRRRQGIQLSKKLRFEGFKAASSVNME